MWVNATDRRCVPIHLRLPYPGNRCHSQLLWPQRICGIRAGLKSLADAVAIRNRILQAFEQAEAEEDPARHRDLLTFVLVGAGPTGVEMAGAIAVLIHNTLKSEFRRISPESARIILLDMGPRVLGLSPKSFPRGAGSAGKAGCGGSLGTRRGSD